VTAMKYYSHVRHDVLAHVPQGVRRVLSIGCGAGCTEAHLVARGIDVTGVELDAEAGKAAALAGVNVIHGDAGDAKLSAGGHPFDCLIYADVLEHLPDPESVIRDHVQLLAPDAAIIISIPNFRHYSVFSELFLSGHVRYRDAGILDRTHVRITTRRMVQEWFDGIGLATVRIDYRIHRRRDRLLSLLSFGFLREFLAYQVIVVGQLDGSLRVQVPAFA